VAKTANDSSSGRLMLLSIHPRHVQNMLTGIKTVELRRTRPAVAPGQPVAIYATTPAAAIVATCRIERVEVDTPPAIWAATSARAAVTREEFDRYFEGSAVAVALHLSAIAALRRSVPLTKIREHGVFHPPQTWHYLDRFGLRKLFGEHPSFAALQCLI
jgi:predicted transcriptional regulator